MPAEGSRLLASIYSRGSLCSLTEPLIGYNPVKQHPGPLEEPPPRVATNTAGRPPGLPGNATRTGFLTRVQ